MIRIDLIDPNTRLKTGSFPITTARQVVRRRKLDAIGKWEFDMGVVDPAFGDIAGKDFDIYWMNGQQTYSLGLCQYLRHRVSLEKTATIEAAGYLRDLSRETVLQRSFDGASDDVNDVLSSIVPLRSGWSLGNVDTISKAAPMDFWYEDIYYSVALLAKTFGYHFREGNTIRTLDFGAFGTDSGVMAIGGEMELPPEIYANPGVCHIETVEITYERDRVVNQLIPFGGAVGVATIDLSETTSTQPGYPINSAALPGGGSYYYIQDSDSINDNGLTSARFLRKDLRPISNSPAAREYAANLLYEAALASLLNLKDQQTIYELSVIGLEPGQIEVGDKIRVRYVGVAEHPGSEAREWISLDDDFYVLEIEETFGDGVRTRLTINQNDVAEETIEDLLANTIREFETAQIHVQPTISRYTVGPYTKRVSTSVDATFSFKLGPETLTVWYVKIQVTGEPLKSSVTTSASGGGTTVSSASGGGTTVSSASGGGTTVSSASGGGTTVSSASGSSHNHNITVYGGAASTSYDVYWDGDNHRFHLPGVGSGSDDTQTSSSESSHTHNVTVPNHTHNVTVPDHTHNVTVPDHTHDVTVPDHTHDMTYGIYEDTVRPNNLTIRVNGSIVASGVTLAAGNNYTYELDITSQILAAATLQQEHTVVVEAGSDRGEIVFQAQVLAVIQGIEI